MSHIMQVLHQTGAMDLLAPREVHHKLLVQWPGTGPLEPGQPLPQGFAGQSQHQPLILTDFQPGGQGYVMLMVARYPGNPDEQTCTWLLANVPVSNGRVAVERGMPILHYKGAPMAEDSHANFVFLLLNPMPGRDFNPQELLAQFGGTGGFSLPKLNTREFLQDKGLDVVAATVLLG